MAFKVDFDALCTYETTRMVKIKDKRLFAAHVSFLVLIFLYIICWNFGVKKNYLQFEEPRGTVRTTLRRPEPRFSKSSEELPYCGSGEYVGTDWRVFDQRPCKQADAQLVVFPSIEESSLFATTRMKITQSELPAGCTPYSVATNCEWEKKGHEELFIANLEYYTLFVDHTLDAAHSGMQRNSKFMSGELHDKDGNTVNPCDDYPRGKCPKYVTLGVDGKADIIPLKTLLRAAGVDLDSQSKQAVAIGSVKWESRRYAGVVLILRIFYDNTHSFSAGDVRYTYTATLIPKTEYKVEEPVVIPPAPGGVFQRTTIDRHGIRIIIEQTGKVGSFDFQTFLINLASSLGLLAVATVLVDLLAVKLLPQKEFYEKCKYMDPIDPDLYHNGDKRAVVDDDISLDRAKSV